MVKKWEKPPSRIFCKPLNIKPVADPDHKIRGEPGHPDCEIRGGGLKKKVFSALRASDWSKNKGRPGPSAGSATAHALFSD